MSLSRVVVLFVVVWGTVFGAPSLAAAQGDADAAKERAKQLFIQGLQNYQAGRYNEALAAFNEANQVKPHPVMLFNIAQVLEAMGRLPEALIAYQQFEAAGPPDPTEVQTRIARLRQLIATTWGQLQLTSEPPGATVWINSKAGPPLGQTPLVIQMPVGQGMVLVELAGHQPLNRPIQIAPGTTTRLAVALPPVLPVLAVNTAPPGAAVKIAGAQVGVTPHTQALVAGKHTVSLELAGHATVTQEIVLLATHTVTAPYVLNVTLQKETNGRLVLDVQPVGAIIAVDGANVGTAPLAGPLTLPQGLHSVEVKADGAIPLQEMVNIVAGQTTQTQMTLEVKQTSGISGQTWGWVMMGVGGASLLSGGVFGVLAMSADSDLSACRSDDECSQSDKEVDHADTVRSRALTTDILVGTGVAIAATGAVFYLFSGNREPSEPKSSVGIAPMGDGGATAVGTFEF